MNELHEALARVVVADAGPGHDQLHAAARRGTNVNARVAAVANPDDPSSHFAQVCKPGSGWVVKRISAFDTPAYTGEKVPEELLPLLVSREWVEERKIRGGVNSPIYQSKVLG